MDQTRVLMGAENPLLVSSSCTATPRPAPPVHGTADEAEASSAYSRRSGGQYSRRNGGQFSIQHAPRWGAIRHTAYSMHSRGQGNFCCGRKDILTCVGAPCPGCTHR